MATKTILWLVILFLSIDNQQNEIYLPVVASSEELYLAQKGISPAFPLGYDAEKVLGLEDGWPCGTWWPVPLSTPVCQNGQRIPMIFSDRGADALRVAMQRLPRNYDGWLLAVNEPGMKGQAGMSPLQAAQLMVTVDTMYPRAILAGPCFSPLWSREQVRLTLGYMAGMGVDLDALCLHVYAGHKHEGAPPGPLYPDDTIDAFYNAVPFVYKDLVVYIHEAGILKRASENDYTRFMQELNNHPKVIGWSYFDSCNFSKNYWPLVDCAGELTPVGEAYRLN